MGDRFDTLAKDAATLPRREVFRRIGGGLMAILLATVGLSGDSDNCAKACAECCNNRHATPRNKDEAQTEEHGKCIRDCHAGLNECGVAVRLPGAGC